MKYILTFLALLMPLLAATHVSNGNATGAGSVQAIHDDAGTVDGDTITIPAGTYYWSSAVTITKNINLIGAGTSAVGGGDQTIIIDNYASGSYLLEFGGNRLSGITFQIGTGSNKSSGGLIKFSGTRLDHCHFDNLGTRYMSIVGSTGVCYRNVFSMQNNQTAFQFLSPSGDFDGDVEWAAPTGFGTSDFFYVEDNVFHNYGTGAQYNSSITDGNTGGKFVIRFNTVYGVSLSNSHGTGHSLGNDRGIRAQEVYANSVTKGADEALYSGVHFISGTALVWGNSWDNVYRRLYLLSVSRLDDTTYAQNPNPDGWGYGGSPRGTGSITIAGTTLTHVSGDTFDSGWVGRTIHIDDGTTRIGPGNDVIPARKIASVDSSTQITLAAIQNGNQVALQNGSATYWVGSVWDGNTDSLGYPLIDQPGRGQGDLLTGFFPNRLISGGPRDGTAVWPEQALEPIYIWNNAGTFNAGDNGAVVSDGSGGLVVVDRDYYLPVSGIQTSPTSPFNGTKGGASGSVGWGTLANRPTTATTGVAYWATDQGDWNQSTSNSHGVQMNGADGVLYVATATDTWTLYYEPYTYPHPLRNESSTSNTISTPRSKRSKRITRSIRISGRR